MNQNNPLIPLWKKQIPMWITWGRIAITPAVIILLMFQQPIYNWAAAILFVIASLSDYLDGFLARYYKSESTLGAFMDPVADKLLVSSILIMLIVDKRTDPLMVIILLGRDTLIGALRSMAATHQIIIAAKPFGKWKTAIQMICIPFVIINSPIFDIPTQKISYWGLWLSVVLSLISAAEYTFGYFKKKPSS